MGKLKGQTEYENFKKGMALSPKKAIKAACYACNGENDGSGEDCRGLSCPLYPYFKKWVRMHCRTGGKAKVPSSTQKKGDNTNDRGTSER